MVKEWQHEHASDMLLKHMIDQNYIDDIEKSDVDLIGKLINGDDNSIHREKGWMFDIVANKRNSIDVDKFDYIMRDAHNTGLKSTFTEYTRVINGGKSAWK